MEIVAAWPSKFWHGNVPFWTNRENHRMKKHVAVLTLCFTAAVSGAARAECQSDRVDLRGDWGQASFIIEIADTREERAQGLMFRESMPRGAGMLFVYEHPQPASFWMKNTLIPLDIIFTDLNGMVTRVHSDAIPGDLTAIPGGGHVFAVLEINAGLAARYGITAGTELRHQVFSEGPPKWSC